MRGEKSLLFQPCSLIHPHPHSPSLPLSLPLHLFSAPAVVLNPSSLSRGLAAPHRALQFTTALWGGGGGGGGVLRGGLYFQGSYYNYMTKCCKSHRVPNTGAGVRGQSTFSGVICKCHSGGLLCQSLVSAAGFLMQISRIRAANASFCWPPWQYYQALLVKSAKICDKKKHSLRSWKIILITVLQNVFLVYSFFSLKIVQITL